MGIGPIVVPLPSPNILRQAEWANGHNCFAQWQHVGINESTDNEIRSDHCGLAGVIFCDGHAEFLAESIAQSTLLALLTRAGQEIDHGSY